VSAPRGPGVEWNERGSRLKASRGSDGVQRGGGKRDVVGGFSLNSRRRLLQLIGSIRRDCVLPVFVTLTYPSEFPYPNDAKRHLKLFLQALRYRFAGVALVWKIEPQERGAPHFHMLIWGVSLDVLRAFVPGCWFRIAGNGDRNHLRFHEGKLGNEHCCGQVKSFRGVWFYAAKYIGKTFEIGGWKWPGRFWGVCNRSGIPFGVLRSSGVEVVALNDVMRYQRRFAGVRARGRGMTVFCDADQWVHRLQISPKNRVATRDAGFGSELVAERC
jgi:hypothetical protein